MQRKIGNFLYEDVQIEYSVVGTGEPILVMHGGHSNCYEEFGYEALVKNGFSVITPSRAGYGGTSRKLGKSLALSCQYYAKLLQSLNVEKVHVLAISAGGPSGIYFAATYPKLVRTLTLQSAVTKSWLTRKDTTYKVAKIIFHPRMEKYIWKLISLLNNAFPRFIFKQMYPTFSTLTYAEAKDKFAKGDIEAIRKMNNRQRSGFGFLIDLAQTNVISLDHLQAISCPVLIMHSNYDHSVSLDHAHFAHENITNSKLCLLDAWGHLIWLGKTAYKTDKILRDFLTLR